MTQLPRDVSVLFLRPLVRGNFEKTDMAAPVRKSSGHFSEFAPSFSATVTESNAQFGASEPGL